MFCSYLNAKINEKKYKKTFFPFFSGQFLNEILIVFFLKQLFEEDKKIRKKNKKNRKKVKKNSIFSFLGMIQEF